MHKPLAIVSTPTTVSANHHHQQQEERSRQDQHESLMTDHSVYQPVPSSPHKSAALLAMLTEKSESASAQVDAPTGGGGAGTKPIPLPRWWENGGKENMSDDDNDNDNDEEDEDEDEVNIGHILISPAAASAPSRHHQQLLHLQTKDLAATTATTTTDRRTFSESATGLAEGSAEHMQYLYGGYSGQSSVQSATTSQSVTSSSISTTGGGTEPSPLTRPTRQYSWRNPRPRNMRRSWSLREDSSEPVSPASKFLAMFNAAQSKMPAPEPDDEGQEVTDHVIGKVLGYGGFSVVKEAHTLENGTEVTHAVKIVRKSQRREGSGGGGFADELAQADLDHELTIWRCIVPSHPHILRLLSVHETEFATFCFMQYANAGSVFETVIRKQRSEGSTIPIDVKVRWMFELCSALRFLHQDLRIVHRDVKPENCLLHINNPKSQTIRDAKLLLCDFGMSEFITDADDNDNSNDNESSGGAGNNSSSGLSTPQDDLLTSSTTSIRPVSVPVPGPGPQSPLSPSAVTTATTTATTTELGLTGSVPYLSPELLVPTAEPHRMSPKQDIWATGVFTYILFTGTLPFSHSFLPNLQRLIVKGDWDKDTLRNASNDDIVDFVSRCFYMHTADRWDIGEALRHDIFQHMNHPAEGG
ncbi:kinase-like domain-containing protein [Lipomyces kononenkoae]